MATALRRGLFGLGNVVTEPEDEVNATSLGRISGAPVDYVVQAMLASVASVSARRVVVLPTLGRVAVCRSQADAAGNHRQRRRRAAARGYLVSQIADRINSKATGTMAEVQLHYDH